MIHDETASKILFPMTAYSSLGPVSGIFGKSSATKKWAIFVILCLFFSVVSLFAIGFGFKSGQRKMQKDGEFYSLLDTTQLTKVYHMSRFQDFHNLNFMLQPRVSGTEENKKIQDFIISTFKNLNWHIEEDEFISETPMGNKTFKNIIATKDPRASKRITFAAHFDSKYFKDFKFVAATDSAVPCAIMIDLAISLNDALEKMATYKKSESTLQMIFFDGEEAFVNWSDTDSLYGSRHLAKKWSKADEVNNDPLFTSLKNPVTEIDKIQAMILLDLLGTHDAKVPNSHPETNWIYFRLVDIQRRLSFSSLLSQNLQSRIQNPHDGGIFSTTNQQQVASDAVSPFLMLDCG
jgi:hypothetical protein